MRGGESARPRRPAAGHPGEDSRRKGCHTCPIRVCARKNCWRDGGRELYRELEHQIKDAGLGDIIKLKAVDCLDNCKHGPAVEVAGTDFLRCKPHDAERILRHLTGATDPRERQKFPLGTGSAGGKVDDKL